MEWNDMAPALQEMDNTNPRCPDGSGQDVARRSKSWYDNFFWRQLSAARLEAVAEKIAAGCDLDLNEAVLLSRAGLALLGRIVQLRPAACESATAAGLPIQRVPSLPKSPRHIGQRMAEGESFCQALIALRDEVSPNDSGVFWYPIVDRPLDRDCGCDDDFTGVEVLRAIALARLILPAEIQVQAPLATLGSKLAQVALDFGASHLGYVALDGQKSNDPLVAESSVLDELLGSCLPTPLKEEPALPS